MRIFVTFAIKAEFSQWSSRHPFVPYEFENWETRREFDLFKANIGPDEVTVLLTGIGAENAAKAMLSVPLEIHDVCISSGLAGSLDTGLRPGDASGCTCSCACRKLPAFGPLGAVLKSTEGVTDRPTNSGALSGS